MGITNSEAIGEYRQGRWRRQHAAIQERFGYRDFSDPRSWAFGSLCWLCALCWTETERPSSLGRGTRQATGEGRRDSGLERLRLGPVIVSGPALVRALERLQDVRGLEIRLPATVHVAPTRRDLSPLAGLTSDRSTSPDAAKP